MKLNKINFRQPKYIFPLVILLPLLFLAYVLSNFSGKDTGAGRAVATDSINMTLPDAAHEEMGDKMAEMNRRMSEDGAYTAVNGLGEDEEIRDSTGSGYSEQELDRIDAANAERARQQKAVEQMQRSLAESRRHINTHQGSQQDDFDRYAREVDAIQRRSEARQRAYQAALYPDERSEAARAGNGPRRKTSEPSRTETPAALVEKVRGDNQDRFHTLTPASDADAPLIRAMIDRTTKAHEGTRLRFKLLDDVTISGTRLPRGTYLYGLVTGFGQQRVMARITSILLGDRFIRVSLSVYDNDGMEGFYVPESAFRDMMKDAGAQSLQNNITFDTGSSSEVSGEAIALQALQNMYQSATSAISGNIRKNKARIKYNTIVYLINTSNNE